MHHHTERAPQLRRSPTKAEQLLWRRLRFRQLGTSFRRQHPIAGFIVDFHAPALLLAIELDGGQHATDAARDELRTNVLLARGVAVLRFWNSEITENLDGVCEAICRVAAWLQVQTPPLSGGAPSPCKGEGRRGDLTRAAAGAADPSPTPPLSGQENDNSCDLPKGLRLALPAGRPATSTAPD
jgi:very-short-patch-repair endonuclease